MKQEYENKVSYYDANNIEENKELKREKLMDQIEQKLFEILDPKENIY